MIAVAAVAFPKVSPHPLKGRLLDTIMLAFT